MISRHRRSSTCSSTSDDFDPSLYRGGFLLVAIVSAVLIAATVHPASKLVPWLLGFGVFRWIGVRSYGIYLWHWPIYMVTRPHSDVPITGLPLLVLRLTLTFVAAAAVVQVHRGADPPRRDRTPVGALQDGTGARRNAS